MILTARELDCQFIWNAHAALARRQESGMTLLIICVTSTRSQACPRMRRPW